MNSEFVKNSAVLVGIVLSFWVLFSAGWVWLRKQTFGYGGSVLCGAGVILIGLSIWSHVDLQISAGEGFKLQLAEIQKQLAQDLAEGVSKMQAQITEANREQLKILAAVKDQQDQIAIATKKQTAVFESWQGIVEATPEKGGGGGLPKGTVLAPVRP